MGAHGFDDDDGLFADDRSQLGLVGWPHEAARALGAAQTIPIRGDVHANIEDHLKSAHVAAGARAQVLVFPELSLTGYEFDLAATGRK